MDLCALFKYVLELHVYDKAKVFEEHWISQVHNIPYFWNKLVDIIDRSVFRHIFVSEANKLGIKNVETFDLSVAFENSKTKWKVELMTKCANHIASFHVRRCIKEPKLVKWNGKAMVLQWKLIGLDIRKQLDTLKLKSANKLRHA